MKDLYHSMRRAYRIATRDFCKNGATAEMSCLCLSNLRKLTNNFDPGVGKPIYFIGKWKTVNGKGFYSMFVSLACQRWIKNN